MLDWLRWLLHVLVRRIVQGGVLLQFLSKVVHVLVRRGLIRNT